MRFIANRMCWHDDYMMFGEDKGRRSRILLSKKDYEAMGKPSKIAVIIARVEVVKFKETNRA